LQIGEEIPKDDHLKRFIWPPIDASRFEFSQEPASWVSETPISMFIALGPAIFQLREGIFDIPREMHDNPCPRLQHIRIHNVHLDDGTLFHLRACLRIRQFRRDCSDDHEDGQSCRISTKSCTYDINWVAPFPDVTNLSYLEFEEVLADLYESPKPLLDLLFGDN